MQHVETSHEFTSLSLSLLGSKFFLVNMSYDEILHLQLHSDCLIGAIERQI